MSQQQEQLSHYHTLINQLTLTGSEQDTDDLSVLTYMAHIASEVAQDVRAQGQLDYPFITYREASHHALHRVIIYANQLPVGQDLPFVGFVSQRRPTHDPELSARLAQVDMQLITELAGQSDLLTYSSLQLHDGNWCNLVQFVRTTGKEALLGTKTHQHAAYELAPLYYHWIRLHHGSIPQGELANGLHLQQTKYYTFAAQPALTRPDIRVQQHAQLALVH